MTKATHASHPAHKAPVHHHVKKMSASLKVMRWIIGILCLIGIITTLPQSLPTDSELDDTTKDTHEFTGGKVESTSESPEKTPSTYTPLEIAPNLTLLFGIKNKCEPLYQAFDQKFGAKIFGKEVASPLGNLPTETISVLDNAFSVSSFAKYAAPLGYTFGTKAEDNAFNLTFLSGAHSGNLVSIEDVLLSDPLYSGLTVQITGGEINQILYSGFTEKVRPAMLQPVELCAFAMTNTSCDFAYVGAIKLNPENRTMYDFQCFHKAGDHLYRIRTEDVFNDVQVVDEKDQFTKSFSTRFDIIIWFINTIKKN